MELIDHIGELIGEPSQTKTGPDNDLLWTSRWVFLVYCPQTTVLYAGTWIFLEIRCKALGELLKTHNSWMSICWRVTSMRSGHSMEEMQGLRNDILSLDDMGKHVEKASNIQGNLFDLHVAVLRLTEQTKKRPTSKVIDCQWWWNQPPTDRGPYEWWHYSELVAFSQKVPSHCSW